MKFFQNLFNFVDLFFEFFKYKITFLRFFRFLLTNRSFKDVVCKQFYR